MPAGYAHYIFGEKVLESLDKEYQDIINRNIDLYHIGVHGPDILFYYKTYKSNDIKTMGNTIHQNPAYDFMKHAKSVYNESLDKEASLAYIYGFITHFTLDHACHPYIYKMQEELDMTHSEIESELDRKLLVDRKLNPLTTSLTTHIHINHYLSRIIAPFYDLDEKDIYKSVSDLLFYLEWIRAPGKMKRYFVYLFLKLGGMYDEYKGLLINYQPNPKSKDCTLELVNRINSHVMQAKQLIEEFLDHDINDIYENNFE